MKKLQKDLCELVASVKDEAEADLLLSDLLTPQERDVLAERWQIVQLLAKGVAQRKIAEKLGASISTVTRGSLAFQYGKKGFLYFLKKLKKL
jgi:Trp operon repressor